MSGNNLNISLIDNFRRNDWCLTLLTHKFGVKHILILVYFTCFSIRLSNSGCRLSTEERLDI
jgi:hypothetical protein